MNKDIYSSGPVASLPGSSHSLPDGTMCDDHPDVLAVSCIQGETDSFGAEYHCLCQACVDELRTHAQEQYAKEQYCDWCKRMKTHCRNHRDIDEGSSGQLYLVCRDCRNIEADDLRQELAESGEYDDYDDTYSPSDDFDPSEDYRDDVVEYQNEPGDERRAEF